MAAQRLRWCRLRYSQAGRFIGCYRQMRTELQMRNGPLVWLAFSLFLAIYVAGFASLGGEGTIVMAIS